MIRALLAAVLLAVAYDRPAAAQDVSAEYRVKAAYLYQFVRFVDWPSRASSVLTICVGGRNPFGSVLDDLVRGEVVAGRRLESRVIPGPQPGCNVMFIPQGANTPVYLRDVRGEPTLTVGEEPGFISIGGMARFYIDGGSVRFEINPTAAEQAGLRISSRLLRLAKIVGVPSRPE